MNLLTSILGWLRAQRREKIVDERDRAKTLATELDKLIELMADVLKSTNAEGIVQRDQIAELDLTRKRVWNRWVSILGTSGYATTDAQLQN